MIDSKRRQLLEREACASRGQAYAPYSSFRVGAAVLAESGTIYTGVNVENASFGLTICAERVAIFKAVAAGERSLLALAVCTANGVAPCGSCRQVMREFATDMTVYIIADGVNSREVRLRELLPQAFGPEDLSGSGD